MDQYEDKLKDETIKRLDKKLIKKLEFIYQTNLRNRGIRNFEKINFNIEANNKSNQIRKEIEQENVLSSETKQANNGEVGYDYEKKKERKIS